MSDLQNEAAVVGKRKNKLKDDPEKGLVVKASLRDQQLDKLADKLMELEIPEKIAKMWYSADADRSDQLNKQNQYLREIDEFIDPIYTPALDWSSTIHLPTILSIAKTYHGRMLQALWGVDPAFVTRARQEANSDRAPLIEDLMRYTLRDWCNHYDGVESELDKWLWDWITKGDGWLKGRWDKQFSRFVDVQEEQVEDTELQMDPDTGNSVQVPVLKTVEKEVAVTEEVYNGPMLERVYYEDVIVVGGEGDPQKADWLFHRNRATASELWQKVDQKIFREDAVEAIINGGKDSLTGTTSSSNIKQTEITMGGRSRLDPEHELDKYELIECYLKVDVDGSGITSDVVAWIHLKSRQLLRATYLRRISPSGKRPFFKIEFHKRHGVEYSVGLVELCYSLAKEIDAIHNINVDIGILSSMPFGFYKPTASSLKNESMPIEPGALVPVDNPSTDVFFPNMGMRTSFGFQEQQALQSQIERLTSISDLNFGLISGQGASRTATGTRALLGESSSNLNVYIARMNRGWKRALRYVFEMLQTRLPPGFQFRVLGDDGNNYWREVHSKEEICGMYDFELDANSANSNKQVQIEQANMIYQTTSNPIDLQLGIVNQMNRYEAIKNMLKVNGVKDVSKYVTKPQGGVIQLTPLEMADRLLHGVDVQLSPTMDIQGFIDLVEHMIGDPEISGQFSPLHIQVLAHKAQEAQQMLQAMQAAQGQAAVASQANMNTQASMVPGNMQPVAVNQQPAPGEGG